MKQLRYFNIKIKFKTNLNYAICINCITLFFCFFFGTSSIATLQHTIKGTFPMISKFLTSCDSQNVTSNKRSNFLNGFCFCIVRAESLGIMCYAISYVFYTILKLFNLSSVLSDFNRDNTR